ncbi:MAG: sulfite exporter TauE/SafE family protein [Actinomycetota bacterium]|nr:sulfite exporter TauE/SafE family protein [Actinomycetota bacterium]
MDAFEITLVALATFAGATLQSATGFGYALLAGPATFAVFEPAEAITILLALGTVLNLLIMAGERRESSIRRGELFYVLAWAVPGVVAGIFILVAISKSALQVIVGIAVLVAVAIQLRRGRGQGGGVSARVQAVAGLAAGTLTTTTATAGPPLVLLLERAGANPEEFRDTMAALLLGLNILGALALVAAGGRAELPGMAILALLVAIVTLGRIVGRLIFDRLDADSFRRAGLVLIVASGIGSIAAGVIAG